MVWHRSISLRFESFFIYPAIGVTHKNSAGSLGSQHCRGNDWVAQPMQSVTDGFVLRAIKAISEVVMSQTTRHLKPKRCPISVDALGNNDACLDRRTHLSGEMWARRAFRYSLWDIIKLHSWWDIIADRSTRTTTYLLRSFPFPYLLFNLKPFPCFDLSVSDIYPRFWATLYNNNNKYNIINYIYD